MYAKSVLTFEKHPLMAEGGLFNVLNTTILHIPDPISICIHTPVAAPGYRASQV